MDPSNIQSFRPQPAIGVTGQEGVTGKLKRRDAMSRVASPVQNQVMNQPVTRERSYAISHPKGFNTVGKVWGSAEFGATANQMGIEKMLEKTISSSHLPKLETGSPLTTAQWTELASRNPKRAGELLFEQTNPPKDDLTKPPLIGYDKIPQIGEALSKLPPWELAMVISGAFSQDIKQERPIPVS